MIILRRQIIATTLHAATALRDVISIDTPLIRCWPFIVLFHAIISFIAFFFTPDIFAMMLLRYIMFRLYYFSYAIHFRFYAIEMPPKITLIACLIFALRVATSLPLRLIFY